MNTTPGNSRSNNFWYCTDQQRFDTIGAQGNAYVQTPTLGKLVQIGVSFTNAYCQSPICTPSRASIMTKPPPQRLRRYTERSDITLPSFSDITQATELYATSTNSYQ